MRETTLCYIEKDNNYLMLHRTKKKADGSYEKWLGVGGKIEKGETPEQCILREVLEETGYTLTKYLYRAKIFFYSDLYEDEIMYLYTASEYTGEQIDCNEGELVWIPKSEVGKLKIWEGDKLFLEKLSKDTPYFELELHYEGDTLVRHSWVLEEQADNPYPALSVCSSCKGACCKSNGCCLSPDDLLRELSGKEPTRENILSLLKTSIFAIDSFGYGNERIFFLRMQHKCFTFIGIDACGECAALTERGCSLPVSRRPKGGRYLEADESRQCHQHYGMEDMAIDWRPLSPILKSIWDEYEPIFEKDGTFDKCEEDYMNYQRSLRS